MKAGGAGGQAATADRAKVHARTSVTPVGPCVPKETSNVPSPVPHSCPTPSLARPSCWDPPEPPQEGQLPSACPPCAFSDCLSRHHRVPLDRGPQRLRLLWHRHVCVRLSVGHAPQEQPRLLPPFLDSDEQQNQESFLVLTELSWTAPD